MSGRGLSGDVLWRRVESDVDCTWVFLSKGREGLSRFGHDLSEPSAFEGFLESSHASLKMPVGTFAYRWLGMRSRQISFSQPIAGKTSDVAFCGLASYSSRGKKQGYLDLVHFITSRQFGCSNQCLWHGREITRRTRHLSTHSMRSSSRS